MLSQGACWRTTRRARFVDSAAPQQAASDQRTFVGMMRAQLLRPGQDAADRLQFYADTREFKCLQCKSMCAVIHDGQRLV